MMKDSLKKIKDIKCVINEFYHKMKCDNQLTNASRECWLMYQNYCEEIEKELERLKKLKEDNKELRKAVKSWNNSILKLIQENLKLKQALDILKRKQVSVGILINSKNVEEYNMFLFQTKRLKKYQLTQKEYELLKEELEND